MAIVYVPSHVNETTDPVDNLGGILSALLVGALVLGINFAPVPDEAALALGLFAVAVAAGIGFFLRSDARGTRSTTSTSPPAAPSGSPPARGSSCSAR